MTLDYAHTPAATKRRAEKAKKLARWCYSHGITRDAISTLSPAVRRRLAQRVDVPPPREASDQLGETWQLVLELLSQREVWDQAHQTDPPAPIRCIPCLLEAGCARHRYGRACLVCSLPLHRSTIADGYATHPSCDPIPAAIATPIPHKTGGRLDFTSTADVAFLEEALDRVHDQREIALWAMAEKIVETSELIPDIDAIAELLPDREVLAEDTPLY